MRLHDRYIFRELLTPLATCLVAFLIFWLALFFTQQIEQIRDAKLHFVDTMEYAIALMPSFLVLLFPFILLFGMLWALTHHTRHNEITALRAAGISLWRLSAPYFVVGLLAVGVDFALNEVVAPACTKWSDDILTRYVKKSADPLAKTRFVNVGYINNRVKRYWKIGVYDARAKTMLNPLVDWNSPDGRQHKVKADFSVYTNKTWVFYNVQQFVSPAPNLDLVQLNDTNEIAMPEFDETPQEILQDIKFRAAQDSLSKRTADIPLVDLWPYLKQHPNLSRHDEANLYTKFHARLAGPWTCFVVVLMAIPFGAQSGRRNLFYGVAGSIFICFAFFIVQQISIAFGIGGHIPGWVAAWLPNIIFAAIGIFLTMRTR